ncbi:unnamed protein product [Onchocerca flexuosa]|uniref:Ovule protein n=1 Tax=Onchocerca flexuosa TaxID=387005 RepID=A0A183HVZ1_9BILA|nr:unnamed protein product [Onchocerca flexuosa]
MSSSIWTTERAQRKDSKEQIRPSIVVPLHKMIEQAIPTSVLSTLSQFPNANLEQTVSNSINFSPIYIHSIDEEFIVSLINFPILPNTNKVRMIL